MRTDWRETRFEEAYKKMATTAKFRPEAPSDGLGTVMMSDEELNDGKVLAKEASRYAKALIEQDDRTEFTLQGCTNGEFNQIFVYLLNATELCFSTDDALPFMKRLVSMALDEISKIEKARAS